MTAAQIISLALSNTHTKTGQISAASLLTFLNVIRAEIASTIIKEVSEDFFFQIWTIDAKDTTDIYRTNGEYVFPASTSTYSGMAKLNKLAVKGLSTDLYHTPAREVDMKALDRDWSWYMVNQPKNDPIYFIADESFFIAPQFTPDDLPTPALGNKQIKAYGVARITDIDASAAETAILIPIDFHPLISLGMEQFIFKARGKKNDAIGAMQEFELGKQKMIDTLTNRDNSPMYAGLPADNLLGYGN
jgi:hypothetical protein